MDSQYYDEVIEVRNAEEINSPQSSGREHGLQAIDSDSPEKLIFDESSTDHDMNIPHAELRRRLSRTRSIHHSDESGSSDIGSDRENVKVASNAGVSTKDIEDMEEPEDVKEILQYIFRYSPPKIDIDYHLHPFIPDYIPAVGDTDCFLKVIPPEIFQNNPEINSFLNKLGLEVLDEPSGEQSDPTLLHMKLRSASKSFKPVGPPPAFSKSTKDIDKWITEIQRLHLNQPDQTLVHRPQIDIDNLMGEWPPNIEKELKVAGFPNPDLDCSLTEYLDIICSLLDIPLPENKSLSDYILATYMISNLFCAIKNINNL